MNQFSHAVNIIIRGVLTIVKTNVILWVYMPVKHDMGVED